MKNNAKNRAAKQRPLTPKEKEADQQLQAMFQQPYWRHQFYLRDRIFNLTQAAITRWYAEHPAQ